MYLHDFWAVCRRRLALLLALLAASLGLCVLAAAKIAPTYESNASLVLIPPTNPAAGTENRFLDLGSLSNSVDVLARSMTSADTTAALKRAVPGVSYDVSHDPTTSAPIVLVSVESSERAATGRMLDALMKQIPRTLDRLQADIQIRAANRITSVVVSRDPEPAANNKSRVRLLGVLAVSLVFLSAVIVAVVDGLALRRKAEKETGRPGGEPGRDEAPAGGPLPDEKPADEKSANGKPPARTPPARTPPARTPPARTPPARKPPATRPPSAAAAPVKPPPRANGQGVPVPPGSSDARTR